MELKNITERIQDDLKHLAEFTATPGNGCTRLPFTKEARSAVEFLKERMKNAGLLIREDAAGNVFGIMEGEDNQAPCVMMGSHYDSVCSGGDFDGIFGVVSAIETARQLKERGVTPKRNYVAAGFCDEEGIRFGTGFFGSAAMLGNRDTAYCKKYKDTNGISIYQAMKEYGLDPEKIREAKWEKGAIGHFIEAHIEQGPVLYAEETELGLVNCIVGIQRYMVTVEGRADHSGTTPMNMRKDAMEAASKVMSLISDWARKLDGGTVATVGYVKAIPGGINTIAEEVEFSVDIRSGNKEHIDAIAGKIKNALEEVTLTCGVCCDIEEKLKIMPVRLSERLMDIAETACKSRDFSYKKMCSGAGHDSLEIGQEIPTIMVFAASKDGRSHCPAETSKYEDLAKASVIAADLAERLLTE